MPDYVAFRITQQTLLAALRRKRDGLGFPPDSRSWGNGPYVHQLRNHWDAPYFGLEYRYPWLPLVSQRLSSGDALGLERLLMDLNWQWLTRSAELSMFGFVSVVAFVCKWNMLKAWLRYDADRAKLRFTELVDKVTHVEFA
ncbi:MAG: DUF2764 family protein [Pirellulaceae bacterium]